MGFFNIGKKDQYGKQKRIEHRGRYLRISRTGGVALRAQAKLAGLTVTANTNHGLRVSSNIAKNTQIALQNGRFVLKGRYGSGATRLNLSKTGVTVSSRNALGTFNWVKPNRSSVKIAGVQLRGKNAAQIQLIYLVVTGVLISLRVVGQCVAWPLLALYRLPQRWADGRRKAQLSRYFQDTQSLFTPAIETWPPVEVLAGMLLVLVGWGRGVSATQAARQLTQYAQQHPDKLSLLRRALPVLPEMAQRLEQARATDEDNMPSDPEVVMALLAQHLAATLDADDRAEALLAADELALALGERTVLQEMLVQIFADFARLQFQVVEVEPALDAEQAITTGEINLNTATLAQLQTLPHIGPERAAAIVALRPIRRLEQLTTIDGIGAARLTALRERGVQL